MKRKIISNDYVVYLQESDYNIRAENDPESFLQAISCKESKLWYNVIKEAMNSMKSNGVQELVELPNNVRAIGYKQVFKIKIDSLGNIERYKASLIYQEFTKEEGINYLKNFFHLRKILYVLFWHMHMHPYLSQKTGWRIEIEGY